MKIEKILAAIACIILVCAVAIVPAFAASNINDNEQELYDKLKDGVTYNGVKVKLETETVGFIHNYLIRDDVDITAAQKDEIMPYIDANYNIILNCEKSLINGVLDLSRLSLSERTALLDNMSKAGAVVDLTVTYVAETNSLVITDARGNIVCDSVVVVKQTGETSTMMIYVVAAALVLLLVAAVVVARKKVRN